jgi:peptide subunit release factor 1 (eRF1)
MEMSVVVKRLLDLLQDDHKNYYELVSFFLDGDISNFEKEKKAVNFLAQEFDTMKPIKTCLPNEIEEILIGITMKIEKYVSAIKTI